jgi:plastocyanin
MRMHVKWLLAAAIALPIAAVSAAPAPRTVRITIGAMAYSAPSATVRVGDTVEWINKDVVDHTATEKASGLWNVSIAPGKTAKVVVKKAGRFDYYCRYHPNMTATLVVASAKK